MSKMTTRRSNSSSRHVRFSLAMMMTIMTMISTVPTVHATTFSHGAFVPPASPTRQGPLLLLSAKKKNAASSNTANKKMQVQLLKHVAGTGQAGQVVQVTPAFFNNKLRPTRSAKPITDDQVQLQQDTQRATQEAQREAATQLYNKLVELGPLTILAKSGPTGQLFGALHAKNILQRLEESLPDEFWSQKSVSVKQMMQYDNDDNNDDKSSPTKLKGDIKHTGDYAVDVSLLDDIQVTVKVHVCDQEDS